MARPWDKGSIYDGFDETDGGEARPRPLKSRRLLDVMGDASTERGGKSSAVREASHRGSGLTIPRDSRRPACVSDPAPISCKASAKKLADEPIGRKASTKKQTDGLPASAAGIPDLPPDTCAVLSVTPAGEGETVNVVLAMPGDSGGKHQRFSFHLLVEQYAELGVQEGVVSEEKAHALLDAGRLCGAIRRGIAMLGYADQSARRLAYKLAAKGVDRETADAAVAYLTAKGYIHEDSTATLRVEQGLRKGWGERRIREDLGAHGFSREAVEEAMEALSDVDWAEACAVALRKRYGEIPNERGERQKLMAAMMRLGFDTEDIRAAMGQFAEAYDDGDFS